MEAIFQKSKRPLIVSLVLIGAILIVFFVSLNLGVYQITPMDVVRTLIGQGTDNERLVLFQFRLPRMVIALLVGAGLAVSGAILQGVTRNGLADPGILGINAGAGLAVVLFIYFFQGSISTLSSLSIFIMPFFALIGALLAALLIYMFAWKNGVTPTRLILVGIGINAAFGAVLILFQLRMNPNDFMQATIWLSGSIWGANWKFVLAILPWILILVPLAFWRAKYLNVLSLGDTMAIGLGVNVEKERRLLVVISVALAGASVSIGGGIAFLGLVAPHIARKLVGPKHQSLIPASALTGALLLLFADAIGKNLLAPSEIPVGIVVSVLGAPYFIYLLIKTD